MRKLFLASAVVATGLLPFSAGAAGDITPQQSPATQTQQQTQLDWGSARPLGQQDFERLKGKEVSNVEGQKIGQIDRITRATADGHPHAVIGIGGYLGLGEKHVAVSLDQLRLTANNEVLISQQTEQQLEGMPAYQDQEGLIEPGDPRGYPTNGNGGGGGDGS